MQYYRFNKESVSRKPGAITLGDAIERMLNQYKIKGKFNETYLVAHWESIMGKVIASRTTKLFVNNKKLYLQISSAPLKNELVMAKHKVIEMLNREVGETIVEEIIFI